jgi:hypothetical protein
MIEAERVFNPKVDLADVRQVYRNSPILKILVREHLPKGACLVKIEANLEVPHLHAIAERDAGLLHLKRLEVRQKGKCTPVYDPLGLMTYLIKPVFSIKHDRTFNKDEAIQKLALVIEAKRDLYQAHYDEVLESYLNSSDYKPGKKIPQRITKRGRPYARLPSMYDFYPLDLTKFA